MARKTIEERVVTLEHEMMELRDLPAQVTELRSEISQLRTEMRGEFSAIRGEMATKKDLQAVRGEMGALGDTLRGEMASGFAAVGEELAALRSEIIAGDEETRRQMRILHEDLVGRIALIQEGLPRRRRRKSR